MTLVQRQGAAFSAEDHGLMAHALRLAARGLYSTRPNPRVGCVLVKEGRIIGESWHERAGGPHAEIAALAQAGEQARGASCYVTLEPCCHHGRTPPCTESLIAAGVGRVIAAMVDPNPLVAGSGLEQLRAAGVAADSGPLKTAAEALNIGFCQRMRTGRPWVRVKVGMSLDGRVALASGESQWITGEASRRDVQHWRARSCAVMTGVGTVLADDPVLTVREPELVSQLPEQPLRIVLDTRLRTPSRARVLQPPGQTMIMTSLSSRDAVGREVTGEADFVTVESNGERLKLEAVLDELAKRAVNEVLVEAGPTLTGALLKANLADELICYMAPKLLGHRARPMVLLDDLEQLNAAVPLELVDVRQLGADLRLMLKPKR